MDTGYSGKSLAEKLGVKDGVLIYFVSNKTGLEEIFPKLKKTLKKEGSLWIGWPKKASKMSTDLNENIVQEIGLKNGLVDIKVISVDENWSALKFVYRLKDRN